MGRKINNIFWFLWFTTFLLFLLEAFTYTGFVIKHFGLKLIYFVALTIFFSLLLLFSNSVDKQPKYNRNALLILITSITTTFIYVVFKIFDRLIYTNFVFSKLHIQPSNLLIPVLITFIPVVIMWLPKFKFKKSELAQSYLIFFTIILIVFNIYKTYKTEWWAFQFIINNPHATYGEKMSRAIGSEFYNFTQFINKYTTENSRIIIPPQGFPWPQSGNEAFMRYFIHPRRMTNGSEYDPKVELLDYDYVILNWGETETTQDQYTHGWPKFDVPAIKTIFMNGDGTYAGEVWGDYNYKSYIGKKVWGLIVIKH